jgi:hypothetical protein
MRWLPVLVLMLAGCVAPATDSPPPSSLPSFAIHAVGALANLGTHSAEPSIAVRGGHAVVAHIEYSSGEASSETVFDVVVHTTDDGSEWTTAALPASVTAPFDPAGRYIYRGDPVLAYAPDGALWLAAVAAQGAWRDGAAAALANPVTFITKSSDGGATWSPAVAWFPSVGAVAGVAGAALPVGTVNDKPWVAVAPDGVAHLCWAFFAEATPALLCAHSPDWRPILVAAALPGRILQGTTLAAPAKGTLFLAASDTVLAGPDAPDLQRVWASQDGGTTFTERASPGPAILGSYGTLVGTLREPEHLWYLGTQGDEQAYIVESTDGAAHWSAPTPLRPAPGPQRQPAGWFDDGGRLHVVLYDTDTAGERTTLGIWNDGTFTAVAGNRTDPGPYRRDYLGISGAGDTSWAAWVAGDVERTWIAVARSS